MSVAPAVVAGVATDVGLVRSLNEDHAWAGGSVFVVADGMGGHAAGEVASELAVRRLALLDGHPGLRVRDIVDQVDAANREIVDSAAAHPEQSGMGTTVVGLAVVEVGGSPHWAIVNVGDSRVYRLAPGGSLQQVTLDHSEVQELLDAGWITPDEARTHPSRHVVTRSLGRTPLGAVDTWVLPREPGERFLLCSDGLSNEVGDDEIATVLREVPDVTDAARELVRRARERGGRDNITVIVVELGSPTLRRAPAPAPEGSDDGVDATAPRRQVI